MALLVALLQSGLLGEYYNNPGTSGASPPPPPGSPAGTSSTAVPVLRRADPNVDFKFAMAPGPCPGANADDFMISWRGFLTAPSTGSYAFGTISDDGIRVWVNNVLVRDDWVDQGSAAAPEMGGSVALSAGVPVPIRIEMYENGGGESAQVYWLPPGGAAVAIPPSALRLPAGPTADITSIAAGYTATNDGIITLAWAATGDSLTYDLERSVDGAAFTPLLSGTSTTSYTDAVVAYDVPHAYRVRAVQYGLLVGPRSDGLDAVVPVPPPGRSVDHDEGLQDSRCSCGATSAGPAWWVLALLLIAAGIRKARFS